MTLSDEVPTQNGLYVVWIDGPVSSYASRELLMFVDGKWGYRDSDVNFRGEVYQWLGPLPALKLVP